MRGRVLITGGAGFIASHCADDLLRRGYQVRALDSLDPQVHGAGRDAPAYLDPDVELVVGDVRDRQAVRQALDGVDSVLHFAARVGVGQSMYEIADYTAVNNEGTAVLLEAMVARAKRRPFSRLVVASSMSIYGEGLYRAADGTLHDRAGRSREQLLRRDWELRDGGGARLEPVATPESKAPSLSSVYALSKYDQERLCLMVGGAYDIPTVALRFFNVYGQRQALSNPYTGVLAIFASRLLNRKPPLIFEDGGQRRDFVHVQDVAAACRLALEVDGAAGRALNIGSGQPYSVVEIAHRMADALGVAIEPEVTQQYRVGDIRHCFPDIGEAQAVLGYQPRIRLDEGIDDLAAWLEGQIATDRADTARAELVGRGLAL